MWHHIDFGVEEWEHPPGQEGGECWLWWSGVGKLAWKGRIVRKVLLVTVHL